MENEEVEYIWFIITVVFQGQYHTLGLGNSYDGGEPSGPNNPTPADSWDTTSLQDHQLTSFGNNGGNNTDSPNTSASVSQYYLQQVSKYLIDK